MVVSNKFRTFAKILKRYYSMDKNLNVRVVVLPIETYDRSYLNSLTDRELSDVALAEGDSDIYSSLLEFQEALNNDEVDTENKWIYFLTDLA